jgi:hypothetical protein
LGDFILRNLVKGGATGSRKKFVIRAVGERTCRPYLFNRENDVKVDGGGDSAAAVFAGSTVFFNDRRQLNADAQCTVFDFTDGSAHVAYCG